VRRPTDGDAGGVTSGVHRTVVAGRSHPGGMHASARSARRSVGFLDGLFESIEQAEAFVDIGELNVALVEHRAVVVRLDQYAGHHGSFRG